MQNNLFKVPQGGWEEEFELELKFPESWEVNCSPMEGAYASPLKEEEIAAAFNHPIGLPPITQLAREKGKVCIIFDDLSRPTKVFRVLPHLLGHLREAGIKDEQIVMVAALGAHGALTRTDFIKKLGAEAVKRFFVFNHNPFENVEYLGKTSRGTTVEINSEVMSCDLKIGIGSILPHYTAGFGGGAKIMIPGVASMQTIYENHHRVGGRSKPTAEHSLGTLKKSVGIGKVDGNELRLDIEEGARMAGLDLIINVVINQNRDITGLFVGDFVLAHRKGCELARRFYYTKKAEQMDIVVVNSNAKANEAWISLRLGAQSIKKSGGDLVLINHYPPGQVTHYLSGHFGRNIGGRVWGPKPLPPSVRRLIIYSSSVNKADTVWFGPGEAVIWKEDWDEVIELLMDSYGSDPRVAIYPEATVQYFGST